MEFLILLVPILLFGVFCAAVIWAIVFWIMMLVHAAKNDIKDKALWIIIILFGHIVGAIIYYFVVKKNAKQIT